MRYFIYLSYDGTNYHGWQVQPNGISIQEVLQTALTTILREKIDIVGAGRTDAGVNALQMVAHFNTTVIFDPFQLIRQLNRFLPRDINVYDIKQVKEDAHARFDALSRTYKYYITTYKSSFYRHYAYRTPYSLNFILMNEAASHLFNYIDFTSFSKVHTDTKTNNCRIMQAVWKKVDSPLLVPLDSMAEIWEFTIQADRFLRNMVRAIVGTLLDVGRGSLNINDFCNIIEKKNRCLAGTSVPGNALFLSNIDYPEDLFLEKRL